MRSEWRRFAPLGLYLSLLAALAAAGLYIVQREWNLPLQISVGLIVIGLALFAVLDPNRVRVALTGRQARYGSNALVMSVAFIGILVVANYLVYNNSKRWDLTEDKQFTLAPETLSTLESLPSTVKAQAFYTPRISSEQAQNLLDQYQFHAKGKFEYQFIDPVVDPLAAEQAKVTRDGTLIVSMDGRQEPVTTVNEQELTAALVRLINPEERAVYFLAGHGEYSPDEAGEQSFALARQTLESKNYAVKTLNLLAENKIPEDAKIIVIAGPRKPVSEAEVALLDQFLAGGGALIVMAEPLVVTDFGDEADPLAAYLAQAWGINLGEDIIYDQTSNQPFAPFAAEYGSHAITEKMQRITSQFPTVRSVSAGSPESGVSLVELVKTAPNSWAETDLAALQAQEPQLAFDDGQDILGPVSMAVAAENFENRGRLVVFGDSDFVADSAFTAYGNGDLFVNSVDWAAGQENLISLTPKQTTQRMMLPPQRVSLNLVLLGSVFVLPGLALLAGVGVWLQRRKRG